MTSNRSKKKVKNRSKVKQATCKRKSRRHIKTIRSAKRCSSGK